MLQPVVSECCPLFRNVAARCFGTLQPVVSECCSPLFRNVAARCTAFAFAFACRLRCCQKMSSASPRGSCRFDTVAWPHCTAPLNPIESAKLFTSVILQKPKVSAERSHARKIGSSREEEDDRRSMQRTRCTCSVEHATYKMQHATHTMQSMYGRDRLGSRRRKGT